MNPMPGHPDAEIRPTLATHHMPMDIKPMVMMNEQQPQHRVVNFNSNTNKPKSQQEPNEVRFIKTPRRTNKSNNLSRYGSWGYMMLGMLTVSVILLMCGIWECIRRVQKSDVIEQFNANGEPIETIAPEHLDDGTCPQYDPPPPYSSLFPLAKDFNSTNGSDNSAPPSIYFTASSATFLPTAPSPPASLEISSHQHQLPHQQNDERRHRMDIDTSTSPA